MNRELTDVLIERLLAEVPISRAPDRLRADITTTTSRRRQRPPWLTSLKEPPMRYRSQLVAGSPTLRLAVVLAATSALTLAIGGAVIAGASPSPSAVPVPTVAPAWVTGTIQPVDGSCDRVDAKVDVGVRHSAYRCTDIWTASDPRLTGDASRPWNEDTYQTDGGEVSVGIEASHLQNEGGGWACWSAYVQQGATPAHGYMEGEFTCQGSGGYEGLTAVLATTPKTGSDVLEFVGLIFAGDLPVVPEAPPAE